MDGSSGRSYGGLMSGRVDYVIGDATAPRGAGPRVIVHVCNDIGGWGRGFVVAISKRWKAPEAAYRDWHRRSGEPRFALGAVQFVEVEPDLSVANLIGQAGLRTTNGKAPIRYGAVREGLARVREHAQQTGATVHMPRIGCGLAGGRWEEILPIIESELAAHGIDVTVYDLAT
jgi:O-acetyl-ADP-ribose deacetylase (regulator of RNase III)